MTTATHEGFMQAIVSVSDDPAPRLIYADWLEEHGDVERAEFIRVQCELADLSFKRCPNWLPRTVVYAGHKEERIQSTYETTITVTPIDLVIDTPGGDCGKCRWCVLNQRAIELLQQNDNKFRWLPAIAMKAAPLLIWRRGFVEEITIPLEDWLSDGDDLVRETPLRVVCMTGNLWTSRVRHAGNLASLRRLLNEWEPGENPINRLHTLDLSQVGRLGRWDFVNVLKQHYRPWGGLRCLILPRWENYPVLRNVIIKRVKELIPSLETVHIGRPEEIQ